MVGREDNVGEENEKNSLRKFGYQGCLEDVLVTVRYCFCFGLHGFSLRASPPSLAKRLCLSSSVAILYPVFIDTSPKMDQLLNSSLPSCHENNEDND